MMGGDDVGRSLSLSLSHTQIHTHYLSLFHLERARASVYVCVCLCVCVTHTEREPVEKDSCGGDDVGRVTFVSKDEVRVCMYVCVRERV